MERILRNDRPDLKIDWSGGRGKNGKQYVFIRPAKKCLNRSRRTTPDKVQKVIDRHFSEVNYYWITGAHPDVYFRKASEKPDVRFT